MSLQCAISGEPLTSDNANEIVVTPSGHICLKRLLLTKLSENGGVDPFSDTGRPLSEDELVALQTSKNRPNMPPPPSSVSSFSGTLQQLAKEYDSVLLDLFDTRKALQETRRELSQALYQNDAAIRVVARLSIERDAARQEAQRFQAVAEAAGNSVVKNMNGTNSNQDLQEAPPSKKKPRLDDESTDLPLANDIPTNDLDIMLGAWEKLHQARRSKPKTTYTLPSNWTVANTQSWHKSTCRGLTAMAQSQKFIATAGKDKQIMVYDSQAQVVVATISPKIQVETLDVMRRDDNTDGDDGPLFVVAGCDNEVRVYDSSTQDLVGTCDLGDSIVGVSRHPTYKHCVGVTKGGKVAIFRTDGGSLQHISSFSAEEGVEYSYGALHPDGLLVAAGTTKGQILLWDLKNKALASTFPESVDSEDAIVTISFSSNGYHVASAHASGIVRVWDMRKGKILSELNTSDGDDTLKSVSALAFHPDGKYLAYGGQGGVHITMVKEWKVSSKLDVDVATSILWDPQWIACASDKGRTVTFYEGQQQPKHEE